MFTNLQKKNPYILYKQGLESFEQNDFTYASKIFTEAELNFETVEMSAKSAIMSIFCLYSINFYDEALDNLNRYLKKYPADKNIIYAHYLIAIIYFEQIGDEKRYTALITSKKKLTIFKKLSKFRLCN